MSSRAYCLLTLTLTALGLGGVAAVNWLVDPYGQYDTGWLPAIVQASRTQKLDLLDDLEEAPAGLILGSSRVLKIEPSYLHEKTGLRFFNAGVNHGRPTDFLAILRWYHQRWKVYPTTVVLGVDSVALSNVVPLDARVTCERRLASVVPESITLKDSFARYCELISLKQARSAFSSILAVTRAPKLTEPIEYFTPDGLIVYRQREEQLRSGSYDFDAALRYNEREFEQLYRSFHQVSESEAMRLVDTVQLLRQHGTQVWMFITPFHPAMLPALSEQPNFLAREAEARQLLSLLATHMGVNVADFRELKQFNGDPTGFVDGIHPLEENTRLMMDRLLEAQGARLYAVQ